MFDQDSRIDRERIVGRMGGGWVRVDGGSRDVRAVSEVREVRERLGRLGRFPPMGVGGEACARRWCLRRVFDCGIRFRGLCYVRAKNLK